MERSDPSEMMHQHSEISSYEFDPNTSEINLEELRNSADIDALLEDCMSNGDPFSCEIDPFVDEDGFNLLDYGNDETHPDIFEAITLPPPDNMEVLTKFVYLSLEQPRMIQESESVDAELVPYIQRSPYIPGNDHCYSKPVGSMQPTDQRIPFRQNENDSELSREVDIETVIEKPGVQQLVIRTVKKTQRLSEQENVPPRKKVHTRVKAKCRQTKQRKMKPASSTNKRSRSPGDSLFNSTCNKRSTSNVDQITSKRSVYNKIERIRREEQKMAYDRLRDTIPELSGDYKAPKIRILHMAQKYTKYLEIYNRQQKEITNILVLKHTLLKLKIELLSHT